jgi:hypothetical protein
LFDVGERPCPARSQCRVRWRRSEDHVLLELVVGEDDHRVAEKNRPPEPSWSRANTPSSNGRPTAAAQARRADGLKTFPNASVGRGQYRLRRGVGRHISPPGDGPEVLDLPAEQALGWAGTRGSESGARSTRARDRHRSRLGASRPSPRPSRGPQSRPAIGATEHMLQPCGAASRRRHPQTSGSRLNCPLAGGRNGRPPCSTQACAAKGVGADTDHPVDAIARRVTRAESPSALVRQRGSRGSALRVPASVHCLAGDRTCRRPPGEGAEAYEGRAPPPPPPAGLDRGWRQQYRRPVEIT